MVIDYLGGLRSLVSNRLDAHARAGLDSFIEGAGSEPAAVDRGDFFAAHLEIVATARRA